MTLRVKTVEYSFNDSATTTVASNGLRSFDALTVYVPETTSRTIRSAILEFALFDGGTTATSVSAVTMYLGIGAAGVTNATVTQTITNSGEQQSWMFLKDVTAYCQTNFTGASDTFYASIQVAGSITSNASCKLILTYEYDDAAATTRIKTVKIPIDGNTGNLTTTLANVGGVANQIPALNTFLPEASKVYRDIFFEWTTHTGTTAAGASTLDIAYNGTTISDLTNAHTLNSDVFYRRIDKLNTTIINTAAVNSLQAKVTSTTGEPCPCLNGVMVVTYEYDHAASTRIINSIQLPVMDESGMCGAPSTTNKSRFTRDINIQEPGVITLLQSAVQATYIDAGQIVLDFRTGAQPARTFTHAATARCGSVSSMRRVDSGAVGGAGFTAAHGVNTLVMDWFTNSAVAGSKGSNMSGMFYLNYTSDKHALGDGVHNHTTAWCLTPYSTGFTGTSSGSVVVAGATTPNLPASDYWLVSAGYQLWMNPTGTAASTFGLAFMGEIQPTEGEGAGWRAFYNAVYVSDAEIGPSMMFARSRDDFRRWGGDPDAARLDPQLARSYRYDTSLVVSTSVGAIWQSYMLLTHHSITYQIAGNITGSAGGTVSIDAHRTSDGLQVGSTTRVGNGPYSITWYDNTVPVYVEAYEDGTHIGRSDNALAV